MRTGPAELVSCEYIGVSSSLGGGGWVWVVCVFFCVFGDF